MTARDKQSRAVDGVLMYAGAPDTLRNDWTLFGHRLRVAGVDLTKKWPEIEHHLLSVIGINGTSELGGRRPADDGPVGVVTLLPIENHVAREASGLPAR
jgi:hypothetical protein